MSDCAWYADRADEERVTLGRTTSSRRGHRCAAIEGEHYAIAIPETLDTYRHLAPASLLDDEPGDGAEIFSFVCVSDRPPETYRERSFTTGSKPPQVDLDPRS